MNPSAADAEHPSEKAAATGGTFAVVPAFNRADTISTTLRALARVGEIDRIVVVDDGSDDGTEDIASRTAAEVLRLDDNQGKGAAVQAGVQRALEEGASQVVLIDADLGDSAVAAGQLVAPLDADRADMTIAQFPATGRSQGFGLVKRAAAAVLEKGTGRAFTEPLSGQRAIRASLLADRALAGRFGLEIGLTLDLHAAGARIEEIPIEFRHRATGRDLGGVVHRARQGRDMVRAGAARLGWRATLMAAIRGALSKNSGQPAASAASPSTSDKAASVATDEDLRIGSRERAGIRTERSQ